MKCKIITQKGIDHVEFRQATIRDMYGLRFDGEKSTESLMILASRLSDRDMEYFGELDIVNLSAICEALGQMLKPMTGLKILK